MTANRIAACFLFLAALTVGTAQHTLAAVIYVDASAVGMNDGSSWDDAFVDLQDALAAAVLGDEIWVAEGIYSPTSTGDRNATFQMISGVGVYGGFAGDESLRDQRDWQTHETILSGAVGEPDTGYLNEGDDVYHVVTAVGTDDSATLDGCTIQDGHAFPSSRRGGGIRIVDGAPVIRNTRIRSNLSSRYGGGCSVEGAGRPLFENVEFSDNVADHGGGMMGSGTTSEAFHGVVFLNNRAWIHGGGALSSGDFFDCLFEDNFADEGASALSGNGVHLERVVFRGNHATGRGPSDCTMSGLGATLVDVRFENNDGGSAGFGGPGGVRGSGELTNVTFLGNRGVGVQNTPTGGMRALGPSTLTNVVFADNEGSAAGALYLGNAPDDPVFGSPVVVTNVTFFGNVGGDIGSNGQPLQIVNSILTDPYSKGQALLADANVAFSHSLVVGSGGSGPGWDPSLGIDGGGNIDADPHFVDPVSGDYHLQPGSPAINTGDSAALPPGIVTDLDGNPRIVGPAIDMGAYEWQGSVSARSRSLSSLKARFAPRRERQ